MVVISVKLATLISTQTVVPLSPEALEILETKEEV